MRILLKNYANVSTMLLTNVLMLKTTRNRRICALEFWSVASNYKEEWSLNSADTQKKSFSFAYLRRDSKFTKMIRPFSGFILYPYLKTPPHKSKQKVLCSYPGNANTFFSGGSWLWQNDSWVRYYRIESTMSYSKYYNSFTMVETFEVTKKYVWI